MKAIGEARLRRFQQALIENNIDVAVVTSYENVFYLSGCFLYYNAVIVPSQGQPVLLVRGLDHPLAASQSWLEDIRGYSPYAPPGSAWLRGDYSAAIAHVITSMGHQAGRIGFTDYWALLRPYDALRRLLPDAELVITEALLERQRTVKDSAEIETMRASAALLSQVMSQLPDRIQPGVTEHQLYADLAYLCAVANPDSTLWHAVVASGPNSMHAHAKVSGRVLEAGDPVVVDLVLQYQSYYAGITRTLFVSKPSAEQQKVYRTLAGCLECLSETVRPGMPVAEAARRGLTFLEDHGLARYVRHTLGHGIGVFPHEDPVLHVGSTSVLQEGMVLCIEPGVYIEGLGGFRIGEECLVTSRGLEPLTVAARTLG